MKSDDILQFMAELSYSLDKSVGGALESVEDEARLCKLEDALFVAQADISTFLRKHLKETR